jgi:rSAM/selenodomain-associated transferase 1
LTKDYTDKIRIFYLCDLWLNVSMTVCSLGLMAKAPFAGEVKTRLVPPLTPQEAAALNVCFLRDMAMNIQSIRESHGFVVYTPRGSESAFDGVLPEKFELLAQRGATLGDRLCNATDDLLRQGYAGVCLINSDSPTLPEPVLVRAIESLMKDGDRVVLGAAEDGGYYLIGLKHAHRNLFNEIAWSTSNVLTRTKQRAAEIDLPVELLPPWYDVDDAETLSRLCEELFFTSSSNGAYPAPHTRAFLEAIIRSEGVQRICPNRA